MKIMKYTKYLNLHKHQTTYWFSLKKIFKYLKEPDLQLLPT